MMRIRYLRSDGIIVMAPHTSLGPTLMGSTLAYIAGLIIRAISALSQTEAPEIRECRNVMAP
jgi:hypothetical protein